LWYGRCIQITYKRLKKSVKQYLIIHITMDSCYNVQKLFSIWNEQVDEGKSTSNSVKVEPPHSLADRTWKSLTLTDILHDDTELECFKAMLNMNLHLHLYKCLVWNHFKGNKHLGSWLQTDTRYFALLVIYI